MFVQKKYPKAPYVMHVELTEENVRRIMVDAAVLYRVLLERDYPRTSFLFLFDLLDTIRREADDTPVRRC